MISDAPFAEAAAAVLATSTIALMFQARLVVSPGAHPIGRRGRIGLAIFDLVLTTALFVAAAFAGYLIFAHLARNTGSFVAGDRRTVERLLALLVSGLFLVTVVHRTVVVLWKPPEAEYLEPALDDDLVVGVPYAVIVGAVVGAVAVEFTGQLVAQWILILSFGLAFVWFWLGLSKLLAWRSRRAAERCRSALGSRYEARPAAVFLPGDFAPLPVLAFRLKESPHVEYVAQADAWRIKRHFNGARAHALQRDPALECLPPLRFKRGRPDTRSPTPSPAPRGLVEWVGGPTLPALAEREAGRARSTDPVDRVVPGEPVDTGPAVSVTACVWSIAALAGFAVGSAIEACRVGRARRMPGVRRIGLRRHGS